MYGLKVYIMPDDIINRLSDDDKKRFNRCVFTDVSRGLDGSVNIECVVFNDTDRDGRNVHRQRYYQEGSLQTGE